jgi:hypothetical protein
MFSVGFFWLNHNSKTKKPYLRILFQVGHLQGDRRRSNRLKIKGIRLEKGADLERGVQVCTINEPDKNQLMMHPMN